jgi:hypothetical protein
MLREITCVPQYLPTSGFATTPITIVGRPPSKLTHAFGLEVKAKSVA